MYVAFEGICNYSLIDRFRSFLDREFPGHQVVHPPSIELLTQIAKDLKIDVNDQELKENQG